MTDSAQGTPIDDLPAAYRAAGEWGHLTIAGALRASAERRPDAAALASPDTVLTYRQLDERSDHMALGLLRRGLQRGTAVIFQMGTEVDTVVAFYGGKLNVYSGSQELKSASENRVPSPRIQSAARHFSLMNFVPQKPVMPRTSG